MIYTGYFSKFIQRNEKTGLSKFTVVNEDTTYICTAIVQNYAHKTPLQIEGEVDYKKDNRIFLKDIKDVSLYDGNETLVIEYISNIIKGFGPAKALKYVKNFDYIPFTVISKAHELTELKEYYNSNDERKITEHILNITEFDRLYKYLKSKGGDYFNASKYYEKYGIDSLNVIANNPYTLIYADTPYHVCDLIAKENGFESFDNKRIKALVSHALTLNNNNGNTRISFSNLCKCIRAIEKNEDIGYHTDPIFIGEEILKPDYTLETIEDDIYIYKKEDYQYEEIIAEQIKRLESTKTVYTDNIDISGLEKRCKIELSDEQKEALNVLKSSGIKIITGGPGTGKTTLLLEILTEYKNMHPDHIISLCAPTGCAAKRMSEIVGAPACTIHKMLNIQPYESKTSGICNKLDADLIIGDEQSMTDTYIMAKLLSSIKNGATVILLGDSNQLPSVNAGNMLHDLIESRKVETYKLVKIYRQQSLNSIVKNSLNVINGCKQIITDDNFKKISFSNEEDMVNYAVSLAEKFEKENADYKLFTPSRKRKFLSGTIMLNKAIKNKIKNNDTNPSNVYYGDYEYSVGDKVIFTRNNYECNYYNGKEGTITSIQKVNEKFHITVLSEGQSIYLTGNDIGDIELGYAITAHKSQGSECDNAIILVPKEPSSMLLRQLLYVEITRAKKNVFLLYENDALDIAISSYREFKRNTGLIEKILNSM